MLLLTVALAVVVGLSLGLLGGGGSILTVPLLAYVAGMSTREAIAASLVVVGVTSAVGVVGHAKAGRVHWRTGVLFGLAGMAGAYAGGRLSTHIPGGILMIAFAVLMLVTAIAMLRGRRAEPSGVSRPRIGRMLVIGVGVGLVTGLLGAGGGFLIVPALTLLADVPMDGAVGTSLLVITLNTAAGLAGHLTSVPIDWTVTWAVTATAVVGSLIGARLVGRVAPATLRRWFGWFVLAMGALVLVRQSPGDLRVPVSLAMAALVTALGGCATLMPRCPIRQVEAPPPPALET